MTLRRKLLLWYSGVFFLSATVLVSSMYFLIAHKMKQEFFRYLRDEYAEAGRIVRENFDDGEQLRWHVDLEVLGRKFFPLSYEVYDAGAEKHLLRVAPKWDEWLPARPHLEVTEELPRLTRLKVGDDAEELVYLETGWLDREEYPNVILQVGMSYKRVYKRLEDMGEYLLYALVFSVVLSFLGGKFLAARSLDPVDEIASSLERIQAEDLSARLPERQLNDEIGRIVSSANRMLSRLEGSFDRVQRFAGDAAHELRTPMSVLKCTLEATLSNEGITEASRKAMADSLEQVNELSEVVNDLLLLASLDAAERPERSEVASIKDVLDDIGEVFQVLAQQKGLELHMKAREECCVKGDRTLLHRLLCNLVENAIRYTPQGGRVEASARREEGLCCITVADTGIGIDAADMDKIFDPFYRAEESRSRQTGGTGLGLSICRRIVELHGGSISAQSRKGEGTTLTVSLPACDGEC